MIMPTFQPRHRPGRRWGRWIGAVALAAVLFGAGYGWYVFQPKVPGSAHSDYISVAPGQSADSIGALLQQRGIIRSGLAFRVLSRLDHLSRSLKSGVYRLSPSQSLTRILDIMKNGNVVVIKVTIPEGFTVEQIVSRLVAQHIGSIKDYRQLEAKPLPGMPAPLTGVRDPLEGYLFPATYSFPYGVTPRQALVTMWKTFEAKTRPLYDKAHTSLSYTEWITLASIVQQEDQKPQDAPKIAAVFLNRMQIHMPFQSDATVRYALHRRVSSGLSFGDLQVKSPYNTYLYPGLPPGPITNPGMVALNAALHPAAVPYLYFIGLRNGNDLFATTYQQHLANIAYANSHP